MERFGEREKNVPLIPLRNFDFQTPPLSGKRGIWGSNFERSLANYSVIIAKDALLAEWL